MKIDDLDALYRIYADKEITRYMENLYENRDDEREFLYAYIKNMYGFYGYGLWGIILKETGELIGRAGLSNREVDGEYEVELGYMIGVKHQKRGLAEEACRAILCYASSELMIEHLNCFVHPDNEPSIRLALKLGFQYDSRMVSGGNCYDRYVL